MLELRTEMTTTDRGLILLYARNCALAVFDLLFVGILFRVTKQILEVVPEWALRPVGTN